MACYNGSKYIGRQISSILEQLNDGDELIISDDNSSDDTLNIVKLFNDNRIKIITNTGKPGPVHNFENALRIATGDIIFLADQDDKWMPGKIDTHLFYHKQYDLVISDAVVVDENENVIYRSFFETRGCKPGLRNNLLKNSYVGCAMSFSSAILNKALPFPDYIHMHDWWIGLIAEVFGEPKFCNEQMMYYVRHSTNASPTLANSGYSIFKRAKHRLQLAYGLVMRKYI
jgi:glycosyltransferase involved in cell wall biosynthesis